MEAALSLVTRHDGTGESPKETQTNQKKYGDLSIPLVLFQRLNTQRVYDNDGDNCLLVL